MNYHEDLAQEEILSQKEIEPDYKCVWCEIGFYKGGGVKIVDTKELKFEEVFHPNCFAANHKPFYLNQGIKLCDINKLKIEKI